MARKKTDDDNKKKNTGKNVYRKDGERLWLYRFSIDGQSFHGPTGKTVKAEAELFAKQKREEKKQEAGERKRRGTTGVIFADAVVKWLRHKENSNTREKNLLQQTNWLRRQIGDSTALNAITNDTIADVREMRQACTRPDHGGLRRPVRPATVNRTLKILRAILNHARLRGADLRPIDWRNAFVKDTKPPPREIKMNEQEAIEEVLRGDYRNIFHFYIATGLRAHEVLNLTWGDVDFVNDEFTIRAKHDKTLTLKLTDETRRILLEEESLPDRDGIANVFTYIARRTWFNPKSKKQYVRGTRYPIVYQGLSRVFEIVFRKAGLAFKGADGRVRVNARIHAFRHTFGTRMRRAGVDLSEISRAMGHSSVAITHEFYQHVTPDDVRHVTTRKDAWEQDQRRKLADHRRERERFKARGEAAEIARAVQHGDATATAELKVAGKVAGGAREAR